MGHGKQSMDAEISTLLEQSLRSVSEHLFTIATLSKSLIIFEARLAVHLENNAKVIETPVRKLIGLAKYFLHLCKCNGTAAYVPYCLAAVDYLVTADDAVPDFDDYDGFDDDLVVFEYVVEKFRLDMA